MQPSLAVDGLYNGMVIARRLLVKIKLTLITSSVRIYNSAVKNDHAGH
jgi:hypothetical protein